jgi:hypothetical protein
MRTKLNLKSLSDDELLRGLSELLKDSRRVEADLVARIAEVDARRLYAREAAPSMYAYCTEALHLSEAEAWLRIRVARASRKHPMLLSMLRDGRLHLSGIVVIAPHLTPDNREGLLQRAVHRTKRQIEELVAELAPREDAPSSMRRLPPRRGQTSPPPVRPLSPDTVALPAHVVRPAERKAKDLELCPDTVAPSSARPARVEPLAPARYKVQFTASAELRDKLERLQALMRSSVPDGDLATILEEAVTEKLERLEAKRFAWTKAPRKTLKETNVSPSSRHIPAAVRRAVHERDGGRCTFVDARGRRCKARERLEFHHHHTPYGRGGDHSPENIRLMCRSHNALQAELDFGKEVMARHRRAGSRVSEPTAVYSTA